MVHGPRGVGFVGGRLFPCEGVHTDRQDGTSSFLGFDVDQCFCLLRYCVVIVLPGITFCMSDVEHVLFLSYDHIRVTTGYGVYIYI